MFDGVGVRVPTPLLARDRAGCFEQTRSADRHPISCQSLTRNGGDVCCYYMGTNITSINISLPKKLRAEIEQKIERESYGSVSEYLRELIRRDLRAQAIDNVDALLLEGLASGEAKPSGPAFWRKLKAEVGKARRRRA